MKRTAMLRALVALGLAGAISFSFVGCATEVKARDLTVGIRAESPQAAETDEGFITAETALSVALLKAAVAEGNAENVLLSPLSVALALAMTANGAEGATRAEMEALLGGGLTVEQLNARLYTYVRDLPTDEKYKLHVANSIWLRDAERLTVKEEFLKTNAAYYGAAAYAAPFDRTTVRDINRWAKQNTDGMIDKIVEDIDDRNVMYLINALTFDAEWAQIYEKSDVRKGTFTAYTGNQQKVDFMRSTEGRYLESEDAVGFVKRYQGDSYSFVALLPKEDTDIYSYIDGLTAESLRATLDGATQATVVADMPKFSYEYGIKLGDTLAALGMPTAFDEEQADFSALGSSTDGNIYIGNVLHKTYISVDERGTRAGAITMVEMLDGASDGPQDIKYVTLDRPFVYMIVDNANGLPLFIGAVTAV